MLLSLGDCASEVGNNVFVGLPRDYVAVLFLQVPEILLADGGVGDYKQGFAYVVVADCEKPHIVHQAHEVFVTCEFIKGKFIDDIGVYLTVVHNPLDKGCLFAEILLKTDEFRHLVEVGLDVFVHHLVRNIAAV